MKLVMLGENPKNTGGIETFARNLKFFFNKRLKFIAVFNSKKNLYDVDDVVTLFEMNFFSRIIIRVFKIFIMNKKIESNKVYILNSPQYLKCKKIGDKNKIILVQHTEPNFYWSRRYYFNKEKKLLQKAKRKINIMVTLSPEDKKRFIEFFGFEKEKVVCIRHTSKIKKLEGKKQKEKKLIMVTRLNNHAKRIDLAIKAMNHLPDYILNIYGSGPDEVMLKELAVGIDNVNFLGSTNKVQEKLDENGIYIMTSDYEGYGISNIEAMRRGLPIILRNTYTAAQDIIQGNGILLEKEWNEDKFIDAVRNTYENYEEYSKKSVELGRRYDPEIIKQKWEKLVNNL